MKPDTLTITNFSGRLTRQNFGDINSGFAKFDTSWGYDPFLSPGNLTWLKDSSNVTAIITDSSLVLAGKSRFESGTLYTYAISDSGKLWKITGEGSGATLLATLSSGSPTFNYGGTLEIFNGYIWIGHDKGITRINFDGTGETQVGTWNTTNYIQNTYRPLVPFIGKLYYGNGTDDGTNVNIGEIDTTNLITTPVKLSPGLPVGTYVRDLDVTPDFVYMEISISRTAPENLAPVNDVGNTAAGDSDLLKWNGTDTGATSGFSLPSFGITALNSFGPYEYAFVYDTLGASIYEGGLKKLTLRNQKSAFPNGASSNGNFITWWTPETYFNLDTQAYARYGGLFYYGSLDNEVEPGLWRVFRVASDNGGVIYQAPFNHFTTNRYMSVDTNATIQTDSNGTHLLSFVNYSGNAGVTLKRLHVFYIAPPDSWTGAVEGVYETQTQLFSEKISIKQVRVYCKPTVSDNEFSIDLIGPDGKIIPVSNTMNYSWVTGSDPTVLEGNLDRINFNPNSAPTFGVGLRITNNGSQNMEIYKVEVDWKPAGK